MVDGCHFENVLCSLYQPMIILFQWNLVAQANFDFENGHVKKYQNFLIPGWWMDGRLKIVFNCLSAILSD